MLKLINVSFNSLKKHNPLQHKDLANVLFRQLQVTQQIDSSSELLQKNANELFELISDYKVQIISNEQYASILNMI